MGSIEKKENRLLSIAIPTFNRAEMTIEAFYDVYNDERVFEIVISDDASDSVIFQYLKSMTDYLSKVKLFRNYVNVDCYKNKKRAIEYCDNTTDGCILLDSDNIINKDYIDKLYEIPEWDINTIYTPSFAMPQFDFRAYEGLVVTKENVADYIDKPMFEVMLNAANYFVNPFMYLEVFDDTVTPVTSDSIFQCYNWVNEGKSIYVVPGLQYKHRVHPGSHYQNNKMRTPLGFHESILNKLRQMT